MSQGNLKYTPQIAAKILELMSGGLSITAAAAELNITRRIIYKWAEEDRDGFAEIFELAKGKRQLHWERELIATPNAARVTAALKTLGAMRIPEFSDDQRLELTGAGGAPLTIQAITRTIVDRRDEGLLIDHEEANDE